MNAADAMYVGLADVMVSSAEKENLLQGLVDYAWNETSSSTLAEAVNTVLSRLQKPETEVQSNIGPNMPLINDLCSANNVSEVVNAILTANMQGNKWLSRAQSTLAKGSPITMHLVFEQCKKGATMSLADCFRMEADMSCRCGESGEFQEGVRALLIDKDMTPQWKFKKVEDVPEAEIAHFFTSPWSKEAHPLAAL